LKDLREISLVHSRQTGPLPARWIDLLNGVIKPKDDEPTPPTKESITAALMAVCDEDPSLGEALRDANCLFLELQTRSDALFQGQEAPNLKALSKWLSTLEGLLPTTASSAPQSHEVEPQPTAQAQAPLAQRSGGLQAIASRADAIRAIDLVCAYLKAAEPTNPAQLLLARAKQLIDRDFLELLKEFAPDSFNQVARNLGVDPDSVGSSSTF
jgi:type VI secretion system protein ImpA